MSDGPGVNEETSATFGVLIGIGLGPGDPELVTIKAARLIGAAKFIAYFAKSGRKSHARTIAAPYLPVEFEEQAFGLDNDNWFLTSASPSVNLSECRKSVLPI